MSIETDVLEQLLATTDLIEEVEYVPLGDTAAVDVSVLVRRDQMDPRVQDITGRGRQVVSQARIRCFSTVHVDFGGVVSPQVGDNWTLPKVAGGTPVSGWKAGPPRGGKGVWTIPVELWEDHEAGGYDPSK